MKLLIILACLVMTTVPAPIDKINNLKEYLVTKYSMCTTAQTEVKNLPQDYSFRVFKEEMKNKDEDSYLTKLLLLKIRLKKYRKDEDNFRCPMSDPDASGKNKFPRYNQHSCLCDLELPIENLASEKNIQAKSDKTLKSEGEFEKELKKLLWTVKTYIKKFTRKDTN